MKTNIEEMTHEEIIALTDDELEHLISYAMAVNGVKFVKAPEPVPAYEPPFDAVVYQVAGYYLPNKQAADEFAALLNEFAEKFVHLDYDWRLNSSYKFIKKKDPDTYGPIVTRCFSENRFTEISASLGMRAEFLKQYEEAKKEFDQETKAAKAIREGVMGKYNEAMAKERTKQRHKEQYKHYLELAKGDVEIAQGFFKKAYTCNYEEVFGD